MIAVFQPKDLDLLGERIAGNLFLRPERVARALNDQRRRLQIS